LKREEIYFVSTIDEKRYSTIILPRKDTFILILSAVGEKRKKAGGGLLEKKIVVDAACSDPQQNLSNGKEKGIRGGVARGTGERDVSFNDVPDHRRRGVAGKPYRRSPLNRREGGTRRQGKTGRTSYVLTW